MLSTLLKVCSGSILSKISHGIVCFQKVMGIANNLNIHNSDKERYVSTLRTWQWDNSTTCTLAWFRCLMPCLTTDHGFHLWLCHNKCCVTDFWASISSLALYYSRLFSRCTNLHVPYSSHDDIIVAFFTCWSLGRNYKHFCFWLSFWRESQYFVSATATRIVVLIRWRKEVCQVNKICKHRYRQTMKSSVILHCPPTLLLEIWLKDCLFN